MAKTFTLTFNTENDSFDDGYTGHYEVSRLLKRTADQVEAGWSNGPIIDSNGNVIGKYEW